jgi:hypothetical protein
MSAPEPSALACLERTRSAVVNVLMVVGLGIAASGIYLGRRDHGAMLWPERAASRAVHAWLTALILASTLMRLVLANRRALADPDRRPARFFRAHLSSAIVGALAVPLGLAYGWAVRPRLDAVLPFWVSALALGVLALPRAAALEGFASPMADDPPEPSP